MCLVRITSLIHMVRLLWFPAHYIYIAGLGFLSFVLPSVRSVRFFPHMNLNCLNWSRWFRPLHDPFFLCSFLLEKGDSYPGWNHGARTTFCGGEPRELVWSKVGRTSETVGAFQIYSHKIYLFILLYDNVCINAKKGEKKELKKWKTKGSIHRGKNPAPQPRQLIHS